MMLTAQPGPDNPGGPFPFGPGGRGGRGPRGGPGLGFGGPGPGGVQEEVKLVAKFDQNGDKRLNAQERKAAREYLAKEKAAGRGPRRPGGGPGGPGRWNEPATPPAPGPKLTPADVKSYPDATLYDLKTLRTLFLEFENADWEKELSDFYHTDVEVPAKLTVDGKVYPDVGVKFRGASSFFTVPDGYKRSLTISLDFVHQDQRLKGYRTLHLLNSHLDPTFTRSVLASHIAREYIPAPKANYARLVINGESWGVYINQQAFNKDFLQDWFGATKGARWKAPGSPRGNAGLAYLGEDPAPYWRLYEITSKDTPESWAALIKLCRVLNQTPPEKLEAELAPLLDIEGTLKFLALQNVLINGDGYWTRASDYNLYLDEQGRFHIIPHDDNEDFRTPEGPAMRGGGGVSGVELEPLAGANDANKPLLSKLLAAPGVRERYLGYVRKIAEEWLDWNKLGPLARECQALIAADVKADTHKNDPFVAFTNGLDGDLAAGAPRGPRAISVKRFVEQRREYLLKVTAPK